MEKIIDGLYVGNDIDYEKMKDKTGWSFVRCCKEGPGGHRESLGYTGQGAPKGPEYLAVNKGDRIALNFIDASDPNFIPTEMLTKGIKYIHERLKVGDNVLVACNQGRSRSPSTAMLYMRTIGELPGNFHSAERVFRTLYQNYDPEIGVRQKIRELWGNFENTLLKR